MKLIDYAWAGSLGILIVCLYLGFAMNYPALIGITLVLGVVLWVGFLIHIMMKPRSRW